MAKEKQGKMDDTANVEQGDYIEGFALSGAWVDKLKDKSFQIMEKPVYETSQDLDNPTLLKKKLTCRVRIGSVILKYYPNKTSQQTIIADVGYELDKWIGYKGKFFIETQKVGKELKKVIYVEEN